jgi:hypothetical protein
MDYDALDEYERQLIEVIEAHRREYEKAIAPLVRRLAEAQSLRPPRPIVIFAQDVPLGLKVLGDNHDPIR